MDIGALIKNAEIVIHKYLCFNFVELIKAIMIAIENEKKNDTERTP